jgi:predicted GH43/DUF377 family glycosyl hydrolase
MFNWQKKGPVFDPAMIQNKPAWMDCFAQAPSTLIFEDFVRVYFSCRPKPNELGQYVSYSAFVDLNKNNLQEIIRISETPILSLGALGCFDEFGTYPASVIKHQGKYMVYFGGWTRTESVPFNVGIGMGISYNEGVTFERIGNGPVLPYTIDEPFILSGPKIRFINDQFYLFYIAGRKWVLDNGKSEPVYKIRMATSSDGLHWEKHHKDLIESRIEENEAQASPDVIFLNGKYHMFFCYRYSTGYRSKEKGYRIGYASSDDLINWKRDDEMAGIGISENGWDAEMVSYPHVFELNGKLNMFYLGNQVGKNGFGLATAEI